MCVGGVLNDLPKKDPDVVVCGPNLLCDSTIFSDMGTKDF